MEREPWEGGGKWGGFREVGLKCVSEVLAPGGESSAFPVWGCEGLSVLLGCLMYLGGKGERPEAASWLSLHSTQKVF